MSFLQLQKMCPSMVLHFFVIILQCKLTTHIDIMYLANSRPSYMTVKISPIIITVTIISIYLPATIGPWGYTMFFSRFWFEKKCKLTVQNLKKNYLFSLFSVPHDLSWPDLPKSLAKISQRPENRKDWSK